MATCDVPSGAGENQFEGEFHRDNLLDRRFNRVDYDSRRLLEICENVKKNELFEMDNMGNNFVIYLELWLIWSTMMLHGSTGFGGGFF